MYEPKSTNKRKNSKQISIFDFSTLCTKIPHDKLLGVYYKIVDSVFKGVTRDNIIISKQGCASQSSKKRGHHFVSTNPLLKEAIKLLLHNCFFSIGNIIKIQVIGIPMGSDSFDSDLHDFSQTSFQPAKKLTGLRCNVSLEKSMFEKSIIPFGLLMTCYP